MPLHAVLTLVFGAVMTFNGVYTIRTLRRRRQLRPEDRPWGALPPRAEAWVLRIMPAALVLLIAGILIDLL